ncbi:hypothetical protein JSY36_01330 [Bacillus sp. H-16]|nr:hypothetical protein [Alteribacter salitolerans]
MEDFFELKQIPLQADAFRGHHFSLLGKDRPAGSSVDANPTGVATFRSTSFFDKTDPYKTTPFLNP